MIELDDARALAKELLAAMQQSKVSSGSDPQGDLIGTDFLALRYLAAHGQATPGDISRALNVTTARISVVVRRLEKNGMIERNPHPTDLRKFVISLSTTGKQYLEEQATAQLAAVTGMLEYLGPDDAKAYVRIITKLAQRGSQNEGE